jgi:hypothetical protein
MLLIFAFELFARTKSDQRVDMTSDWSIVDLALLIGANGRVKLNADLSIPG